jgi:multisubunit Na+/H+ antiporter MnhB subunit
MAIKLFFILVFGVLAAFLACFEGGVSMEAIVVFGVSVGLATIAVGVFVFSNKEALNALTEEPSEENVRIFGKILKRSKKGEKL